jgi:hypothetical protein
VLDKLAENMKQLLSDLNDVAKSMFYTVTQPIELNITEIVVRPPRAMNIPHYCILSSDVIAFVLQLHNFGCTHC